MMEVFSLKWVSLDSVLKCPPTPRIPSTNVTFLNLDTDSVQQERVAVGAVSSDLGLLKFQVEPVKKGPPLPSVTQTNKTNMVNALKGCSD